MNSFLDLAWLIPAFPLVGASLIGILLVSFNRTMNRLSKPVSFLIINSIGLSTLLSIILYLKHLSGELFSLHLKIGTFDFIAKFSLEDYSSIILIAIGVTFFSISLLSYYKLNRAIGYVRYLTLLSFACGFLYLFVLDNQLFETIFNPL